MKVQQLTEGIWTIDDFLSHQECKDLISLAESRGFGEATVTTSDGPRIVKGVRNNDRVLLQDRQLADLLWLKLKAHCPTKLGLFQAERLNDLFRFYRYQPGQRFRKHRDGQVRLETGEASFITFMIYLNEGFEGGETTFQDHTVVPVTGRALCFYHELQHEGTELASGTKYVLRSDVFYTMMAAD